MTDITASIAKAIQAKTGGNVEGKLPEWWTEFIGMVLAELQSAGRLIPAGGHVLTAEEWANRITLADKQVAVSEAWEQGFEYGSGHKYGAEDDGVRLTAEQVEDVRTAREALRGYRNFEGSISRGHVRSLIAAVDALFPATEPAEEAPNLAAVAQEPRRFDPADECQNDNHDPGCTCGAQHWMTTPAPAEPAEEETKAEACAGIFQGDRAYLCALAAGHYGDHTTADGEHWQKRPASSPVVPAPTETGPWA